MSLTGTDAEPRPRSKAAIWLSMLWADKLAFFAALFLVLVVLCASAWIACQPRMLEDDLDSAVAASS